MGRTVMYHKIYLSTTVVNVLNYQIKWYRLNSLSEIPRTQPGVQSVRKCALNCDNPRSAEMARTQAHRMLTGVSTLLDTETIHAKSPHKLHIIWRTLLSVNLPNSFSPLTQINGTVTYGTQYCPAVLLSLGWKGFAFRAAYGD